MSARVIDLDPLAQVITREMRARRWRHGQLEADERRTLKETMYLRNELVMMLGLAGFQDIRVEGGYQHADPARDSDVLIFIAHKPALLTADCGGVVHARQANRKPCPPGEDRPPEKRRSRTS